MTKILVEVICKKCLVLNENNEVLEYMLGSDIIYENTSNRTQSRVYECSTCRNKITVILDYKGEQ